MGALNQNVAQVRGANSFVGVGVLGFPIGPVEISPSAGGFGPAQAERDVLNGQAGRRTAEQGKSGLGHAVDIDCAAEPEIALIVFHPGDGGGEGLFRCDQGGEGGQ